MEKVSTTREGSIQAFADSCETPSFSFSECMSGYFDNAYLREEAAYQKHLAVGDATAAEVVAVAKFHSLAECYESPDDDDQITRSILRDTKWRKFSRRR